MVEALKQVELDEDIYSLGLRGTIDPAARPDLAEKILKARHALHGRLQDPSYAGLVEPFDADRYNRNLSVAENLLFGTPVGKDFDGDNIAADPYMQSVLQGDRARPRPAAHGPHHRRDHGRAVLRPVARQSVVRAVQLHLGRRTAQRPRCCCSAWAARASRPCPRPTGRA